MVKNVLDMLEEFCRLNDRRMAFNGRLAPDLERRWRALKALYDHFALPSPTADIAYRLSEGCQGWRIRRARVRVPTDMHIFFRYEDNHYSSRVLNLSRGGMFLNARSLLRKGSPVTIYLPNMDCIYGELFETEGEVVWNTAERSVTPLHGMGICFRRLKDIALEQLDSYIIEILDTRLSKAG
jgi:Tfp pilus assembly protein PilZ